MKKYIKLLVVALACLGCTTTVLASPSASLEIVATGEDGFVITVTYQTCYDNFKGRIQCYSPETVRLPHSWKTMNEPIAYNPKGGRNVLVIRKIQADGVEGQTAILRSPDKIALNGSPVALFIGVHQIGPISDGRIAVGSHLQQQ